MLSRACLLEKLDPSQDVSRVLPGNFSLPTQNFNFIIYHPCLPLISPYLHRCLLTALHPPVWSSFCILLQSSIQQSYLSWSELPVREIRSLPGLSPFCSLSSHHCGSSCHSSLPQQTLPHPPFIYLPVTLSVPFLWGLTSLSPADPYSRCEASQITGTSLGLWQAKERSTKHAWLNITLTFNLSSTLSHLCLKLNQPSAIWKSNPPHFISPLKAHPQSLSPLSHTLSSALLPAHCNPEKTIHFAPSSEHHRDSNRWGSIMVVHCEWLFTRHLC